MTKEACFYCLDTGAVDPKGFTPSDSLGPFKACPVCKVDKATKMMDDLIVSEVKDLHMNKFVWALEIQKQGPVNEEGVLSLVSYINNFVYSDKFPGEPAVILDHKNNSDKFYRLMFHGSLIYSDIHKFLTRLQIDFRSGLIKLNRVSTKDYL